MILTTKARVEGQRVTFDLYILFDHDTLFVYIFTLKTLQVLSNLEFKPYLIGRHQAFILKILMYLAGPVATKDEHEDDDDDPEDSSDQGLVAEENVDDALDGRVLRVVLDDLARALKFFVLFLLFRNQAPSCN